jgi:hypothetical protein
MYYSNTPEFIAMKTYYKQRTLSGTRSGDVASRIGYGAGESLRALFIFGKVAKNEIQKARG